MKKYGCLLVYCLLLHYSECKAVSVDSLNYGIFGKVALYVPPQKPTSVALFVSGDGGWQLGVINMARNIANQGALVLGIDAKRYVKALSKLPKACYYPAADFEMLSMLVQKKYNFSTYLKPVLIGYSYGATLVYGILAQAPANTFKGAIALGFSPDLDISRPLCKGAALAFHTLKEGKTYYFDVTKGLTAPFIALHGLKDQSCSYNLTREFLKQVPMARLVTLPKVGHGFSIADNWLPAFNQAYRQILSSSYFMNRGVPAGEGKSTQRLSSDLPIVAIPSGRDNDLPLVFFISGDGGWTSFDQSVSELIAKKGMPVVGLDAQKYFWKEKTPEKATADISKVLTHFMAQWHKTSCILVGFSFGASVVPFIANRLSPDLRKSLKGVYALSPDENADFEIHIADMLNFGKKDGPYHVLTELTKIKSDHPVCVFGREEGDVFKTKLIREGMRVVTLPGGHHYDNDYAALAELIFSDLK